MVNKDGVFGSGQPIYLHDKQLDIYTDLQKQDYNFIAEKGETKDRFEITFVTRNLSTQDIDSKYGVKVYKSGDLYVIEADQVFTEVYVFDASGSLIDAVRSGKKYLTIEKDKLWRI